MKRSNRGSSILPTVWLVTAIMAIAVVVSILIVNDQKDRAERRALEEAYANSKHYYSESSSKGSSSDRGNNQDGNTAGKSTSDGNTAGKNTSDGNTGDGQGIASSPVDDSSNEQTVSAAPTPEVTPTSSVTPTPMPDSAAGRVPVDTSWIDPLKPIVALTFDDGPGIYTQRILDTLKKYNAHATFFMLGDNVSKYPDAVKAVRAAGCEIGNHTKSHSDLKKLSASEVLKEINDTQDLINKTLGTSGEQYIVRPPYGNVNDTVKEVCKHPLILWAVDTLDWSSKNADKVLAEVKKEVKDGKVVLMHDIYLSTADAVDKVVPWLVEQGYQICSVSEMFAVREEYMKDGHIYHYTYSAEEFKNNHPE